MQLAQDIIIIIIEQILPWVNLVNYQEINYMMMTTQVQDHIL